MDEAPSQTASWSLAIREIVRSETHAGTEDITGIVVGSRGFRRFAASFATFGGVALVAASGLGYARAATVAQGTGVAVGRMTFDGTASLGLYVSAAAGAVAAVAGLLALRTRT